MATLVQLQTALVNAHKAGDTDAARRLAKVIQVEQTRLESDPSIALTEGIPGTSPAQVPGSIPATSEQDTSILQALQGGAETGATMLTGMTTGTLGQLGGFIEGAIKEAIKGEFGSYDAADRIEQLAMKRAEQLTYAPKTQQGQEYMQAIGEAVAPLAAIPPLAETQVIAQAANRVPARAITAQAAPPIKEAAMKVAPPIKEQVQKAAQVVSEQVKKRLPSAASEDAQSVGAAAVAAEDLRRSQAASLPVPIDDLTKGQATRAFEAQRFEREAAKMPVEGEPIRERFAQQNLKLQQNLDAFLDQTEAKATSLREIGDVVDTALRGKAAKEKTKIRTLYKEAEKAGELEEPVALSPLIQYLNENAPEAEVANILKVARAKAVRLGIASEDENGDLVAVPTTLKNAEVLRKSINSSTDYEAPNIRQASIMKGLIDEATDGLGGAKYKQARFARAKYARDFEDVAIVKNILGLKRGSSDRAIALEDVLQKSVLSPSTSLDSLRHIRKLLQTEGENGKQAWRELQGGTIKYIKDAALKSVVTDSNGERILSPAQLERVISQLDKSGKLDFMFGRDGAEQLRILNDVAKTIATSPPGTVNTSNTATVLAGMMDIALSASTGIPAPVATSFRVLTKSIKDAKLRKKIQQHLGE